MEIERVSRDEAERSRNSTTYILSEKEDHLSVSAEGEAASDVVSDRNSCRCRVEEVTRETQASSGLGRDNGNDLWNLDNTTAQDDSYA